jgi:hypothetical protein
MALIEMATEFRVMAEHLERDVHRTDNGNRRSPSAKRSNDRIEKRIWLSSSNNFEIGSSTTLADLLTPLLAANPFSTMRASLRR